MTTSTLTTESILEDVFQGELLEEVRDLMDNDYSKAIDFCKLLKDEGIESIDQFSDSYLGVYDTNAQFLEEYLTDIYELQDVPAGLVIDYDASWERNYRFDFFVIEFKTEGSLMANGDRHYFSNCF